MTAALKLPLVGIACIALAACAESAADAPQNPPSAAAGKKWAEISYKKPPRLNGRGEVKSISLEQCFLLHQSGQALVFDARPSFFYHLGHIPGAISLPLSGCDEAIHRREAEIRSALAAGKTLVTYCSSVTCPDARALARHLSGFGYPASIFSGGWRTWHDADLPSSNDISPFSSSSSTNQPTSSQTTP